jgi:quinol-cytochrome oxidoreductase complex cytochrome b subunit
MKKLNLYWRLFIISVLFLLVITVIGVSHPLDEDTATNQIAVCLPFICLYYSLFGIHFLEKYEEKMNTKEQ